MNEMKLFGIQVDNKIKEIDKLKIEVAKANLDELSVVYGNLNPYKKSVEDFTKIVRDEIVNNKFNPEKNEKIQKDAKGDYVYKNLKVHTRVDYSLDEEKAKMYLKELGLEEKAVELIPKISDTRKFIDEVKVVLENAGCKEVIFEALENEYIDYSEEVNLDKYKKLLLNKKLSKKEKKLLSEAYEKKEIPVLSIVK